MEYKEFLFTTTFIEKVIIRIDHIETKALFVWTLWKLLDLSFLNLSKAKKLIEVGLCEPVWFLESSKISSIKIAKSSNKQGLESKVRMKTDKQPRLRLDPLINNGKIGCDDAYIYKTLLAHAYNTDNNVITQQGF